MIEFSGVVLRSLQVNGVVIPKGHISVIGPNGSGKTTFSRICAGIEVPEKGSVLIDGVSPRKQEVGWVGEFPDRNFIFERVFDEVASSLRFQKKIQDDATIDLKVKNALNATGIPYLWRNRTDELSGGEKILVACAAAIVAEPSMLVLDEPDSHLDSHSSKVLCTLLGSLHIPYIIHVTQDMEKASRTDQMLFLQNGIIEYSGRPEKVFDRLKETCFYPPLWRVTSCMQP